MNEQRTAPTIGVFDSGFGGLTVLRALLPLIPSAHYLYLGDTARLPYGSKSQATIARYAVEAARFLHQRGARHLVIACNTATALALDDIRAAVPIPVQGVIQPGAHAAANAIPGAKPRREVLVLATAATVASHAYRDACAVLGLRATEKACPLLVPLIEEGWTDHPVTHEVLRIYLLEALAKCTPDAVLLGCTHYPLIAGLVRETLHQLGSDAPVIDSAGATANTVAASLGITPSQNAGSHSAHLQPGIHSSAEYFATDSVAKFQQLGSAFLGRPLDPVHHLDLGG